MKQVVIIGGGVSGLATGFALASRAPEIADGLAVQLYEAARTPGGKARTSHLDGYTCEWGPNGFLDNAPRTLEVAQAVGLRDQLVRASPAANTRYLYLRSSLRSVPTSPGAFLRSDLLSPLGRLRVLAEPLLHGHLSSGDETVAQFARRHLGAEAARTLVGPMVSGIFAGDAQALSLRAAFPAMAAMEERYGSLFRALVARRRQRRGAVGAPAGTLASFSSGIAELPQALAQHLGDRVHLGTPVLAVAQENGHYLVHLAGGSRLPADAVVLATPAPQAAQLLAPLDGELAAALRQILYVPVTVVCLGYATSDLSQAPEGFGFLVPKGEPIRALGCLWCSSIFPGRAPAGNVLLRLLYGGAHDPQAAQLGDDQLLAQARADLHTAMGIAAAPQFTALFHHSQAIPQYTVGHLERLAAINCHLSRHPGLTLTGNAYRGVGLNDCIRAADAAAEQVLHTLHARAQ